jgi:type VI secretion system FHA domain protein
MTLTLTLIGPSSEKAVESRKVFDAAGGTIGRLPENDWMLADPYVSSRHASIQFADGVFSIVDTSTNGVCLNSAENRLVRGQPYPLRSGDRILIETFQIEASIAAASTLTHMARCGDTADEFDSGPLPSNDDEDARGLLDGWDESPSPAPGHVRSPGLIEGSVLNEPYNPPPVSIPEDYNPLLNAAASPSPGADVRTPSPGAVRHSRAERLPEQPKLRHSRTEGRESAFSAVLEGVGLENVTVTPELGRSFGRILRIVVSGLMDVLQARQQTKEEFRLGLTRFKPADNNPLKFSANVDDALHNLLVKRNAAYLEPVDAFEDAFDDLRHHQMATLAGLRVAFDAMLAEFDPERLQKRFDREGRRASFLPLPGWLRYWRRYRDTFSEIRRDADASFRHLFGDQFGKAYEEQLQRLKADKHPRRRGA